MSEDLGEIAVFTKSNGPLTKRLSLRDGKIVNDDSACFMAHGVVHRVKIDSVQALADLINGFKSNQAYALGRLKDGVEDGAKVVVADEIKDENDPSVIARTKDYLVFKAGAPGLNLFDVDFKGISEAATRRMEECGGEVWGALCDVMPALETVARVERASTSSCLRNTETGATYPGSGGMHIVIPVCDGADVPRFLADFHDRCWLAGLGWGMVSATGSFLERAIIDRAVGSPERFVFEAAPVVEPPLVQEGRDAVAHDGTTLDTRSACPPLTDAEKAELQRFIAAEKRRLETECQTARSTWGANHVKRLVAQGMSESTARAQVERWTVRHEPEGAFVLTDMFELQFTRRELGVVTVAKVLADPERFINQTIADPHEGPGYGRGTAILYRRRDGSLWVKSFAHGGIRYELKTELDVELERLAKLPPLQYEQERAAAATKLGARVTALDDIVEEERAKLDPDAAEQERRPKAADILIALSAGAEELFHAPDGTAYATIPVGGHLETWPIRSKGFRQWLAREFFATTSSAPNSDALQAAFNVIEAQACFDGAQRPVYVRIGAEGGRLYLDLADPEWRAVEIAATGWRIIAKPPVRFRRPAGMLPLPEPVHGGEIEGLRPFLNIRNGDDGEKDFVLTVSFILAALRERGPYPVLDLVGEHGSAKSTFARTLRKLVDPNVAPLRALPREDRDLFIAANNGHLLVFDNVSNLLDWISDTLCRLATGGGFAARQLYSDSDEALFDAMRPIILNGIEDIIGRPDLADRAIFLNLQNIPDENRKPEKKLWEDFDTAHPQILGALLDGVAHGLRKLPVTRLDRTPRMADFALWATACEQAFWKAGTFVQAYEQNRADAVSTVIEADLVATAIPKFMAARAEEWQGTSADLLGALKMAVGEDQARLKEWPQTPRSLSSRLRRAAATLRRVGINITFEKSTGRARTRLIRLASKVGGKDHPNRPDRPNSQDINGLFADGRPDGPSDTTVRPSAASSGADGRPDGADGRPDEPSADNPLKNKASDGVDGADAKFATHSGGALCGYCQHQLGPDRVSAHDGTWLHPQCRDPFLQRRFAEEGIPWEPPRAVPDLVCVVCGRPGGNWCAVGNRSGWVHRDCEGAFITQEKQEEQENAKTERFEAAPPPGRWPGLTPRAVDQLAREFSKLKTSSKELENAIRTRLAKSGVPVEAHDVEVEKVVRGIEALGDTVVNFPADAGKAAEPTSYEVLGLAPGQTCLLCGEGKDVKRIRCGGEGEEDPLHEECARDHLAAMAKAPVTLPDLGPDPLDEHGAPRLD